ncbi:GPI transamidase component [Aspergillus sp. HF37]|nr:GPI transamidase component [Aspergillus sp. HF37]
MSAGRRKAAVFAAAVCLRLVLLALFPSLPDLLTGRVEISTPINSFKRLQEGLFLYTRNVSPYDGGVFHQAPLLLPLFSLLPNPRDFPLPTAVFYSLIDLVNANALVTIAESRQSVAITSCLGRSTTVLTSTGILYAVSNAVSGNFLNSMLALGFASYLSIYPALLFIPLVILCYDIEAQRTTPPSSATLFTLRLFGILLASVAGLLGISALIVEDFGEFISATYGFQLLVPDLTPNVGLWWYFFVEIFDSFREFFLGVFWLHLAAYVGGFTVRLRRQPLFIITSLLGVFAIFKPYPSISDVSLYFALLPLYRHLFPLMRYPFVASSALLYATLLGPAFYHLWIYAGSGNANFFYAITLVWSLGLSIVLADSIFAALREEWELENPEMRGKDARQV